MWNNIVLSLCGCLTWGERNDLDPAFLTSISLGSNLFSCMFRMSVVGRPTTKVLVKVLPCLLQI